MEDGEWTQNKMHYDVGKRSRQRKGRDHAQTHTHTHTLTIEYMSNEINIKLNK